MSLAIASRLAVLFCSQHIAFLILLSSFSPSSLVFAFRFWKDTGASKSWQNFHFGWTTPLMPMDVNITTQPASVTAITCPRIIPHYSPDLSSQIPFIPTDWVILESKLFKCPFNVPVMNQPFIWEESAYSQHWKMPIFIRTICCSSLLCFSVRKHI